jgi:hypothetical protein
MNVLALSTDSASLEHVARIFADQVTGITPVRDVSRFFESARSGKWSIFIVDYDLLKSLFPNPLDLIPQLPSGSQFVFVGAHSFADWHDRLRVAGAIVLHKPNTVGEFGIALRKMAADRQCDRRLRATQ